MNIYDVITSEHDEVSNLFQRVIGGQIDPDECLQLFDQIKSALEIHTLNEEKLVYPILQGQEDVGDLIDSSLKEHDAIEAQIQRLADMGPNEPGWQPGMKELQQMVASHVLQEETVIFDKARVLLTDEEAEKLGEEFAEATRLAHERGTIGKQTA